MKNISVTRKELIQCFTIWKKEFDDQPEDFVKADEVEPERQADYLIEKIDEVKRSK